MSGERTHEPGRGLEPDALSRRHRRRPPGHARLSLNLTAMIDVVFLLLVYFMVATDFKAGEEVYKMDLPERRAAKPPADPFDLDEEPLRVVISTRGRLRTAYRISIDGPYPQPESFEELFDFLRQRRIGPDTATGLFEPDHPIVIAPARATRWEHAMEAFNAAARARYSNVTFARAQ